MKSKSKIKFTLIPTDEIPEHPRARGWVTIIKSFIKSGEKISYLQFDTKDELDRAYGGLASAGRQYGVKISQYSHLLRIYFERKSMI